MAEHYLQTGWRVTGCSRGPASIEHPNYHHYQLDVIDERPLAEMIRYTARTHGLDALINNAGIAAMNHLLLASASSARNIFNTNVIGPFLAIREAGKCMQRAGSGRIINFSTVAVPLNLEGEALYAASKAALESLTRIAARELAPWNITVNAVGPGPLPTDLTREVPEASLQALSKRLPLQSQGTVEDVLQVTDFFLHPRSACISGQTLYLGGVSA
jgi:3-oxoacyl-[acyl-carrier protein] reductase